MNVVTNDQLMDLSPDEASLVEGGYMQMVQYLTSCFAAGFNFGYSYVGPALFD